MQANWMPRNPDKIDYSRGLPEGFKPFLIIEHPRTGGNKKHHFGEVLFIVVTGVKCGMNGFAEIEEFCNEDIEWFEKWIDPPNGVPRAQTFPNIFAFIYPDHFNRCLIEPSQLSLSRANRSSDRRYGKARHNYQKAWIMQ